MYAFCSAACTLFLIRDAAYTLFFFCQGRVYALTILTNFLVGIPTPSAPRTVTDTPGPGSATGVVFRVDYHSSVDDPTRSNYVRTNPFRTECKLIRLYSLSGAS